MKKLLMGIFLSFYVFAGDVLVCADQHAASKQSTKSAPSKAAKSATVKTYSVRGTITDTKPQKGLVKVDGETFEVPDTAKLAKQDEKISLADIKVGDVVVISYIVKEGEAKITGMTVGGGGCPAGECQCADKNKTCSSSCCHKK